MKPKLHRFEEVAKKSGGNISRIADVFCVSRLTVYRWCKADVKFQAAIKEYRGRLFDQCLETAEIIANGIPKKNDDGEIIGWNERPNSWMLKYLLSTLGRFEGFGETIDESTKRESLNPPVPITIEVIDRRELVRKEQ